MISRNPPRTPMPRWGCTTMDGRELVCYAPTPAKARALFTEAGVVTTVGLMRPLPADDRVVIQDKRVTS